MSVNRTLGLGWGSRIGPIRGGGYRRAVISTTPTAYWRLGEPSGTVVADEMGVAPGAYVNTPTLGVAGAVVGDTNTAIGLVGASVQHVRVAHVAALNVGDSFSLACFVTRPTLTGSLFSKGAGGPQLIALSNGGLTFNAQDSAQIFTTAAFIKATGFTFVVLTKSGASVKLYIDGVDSAITVTNATIVNTATDLFMGVKSTLASTLTATMDEPAIWGRTLTLAEVTLLRAAGQGG